MPANGPKCETRGPQAGYDGYFRAGSKIQLVLCLVGLLAGCSVGPDYSRPPMSLPAKWQEAKAETSPRPADGEAAWWKTFEDPELTWLIDQAQSANLDLKQAGARIREARAQRRATFAAGLPTLDATANASRRRNNFGAQGASGGAPFAGGGFGSGQQIFNIFQMGFDANWELDLFGGARRALEAAEARLEAEQENRRAVEVSLLGEVARTYVELRANQRQIAVHRRLLDAQADTLNLTRVRQQAGLTSDLDVAQQASLLAATRARLPAFETAAKQALHALGVLLGRPPGDLTRGLEDTGVIPHSTAEVTLDLPSTLLQRRPDVRRAERQLAAATADIGVATAELYPRINLAAFLGLQNARITDFTPLGKSWSMASSLSMPLFNWGRLKANIAGTEARREQSLLAYQSAVLGAFREVEDALVALKHARERRQALASAVETSRLALVLAEERYRRGLTPFLDVLSAQRAVHEAEASLIDGEAGVASDLIALYKALGGGWRHRSAGSG